GYFLCDDLLHLGYLSRAFNGEPSLLLAPFYSPWLKDTSLYSFYRPLTELSFAFDYMVYGAHAFGYHLTCILCHVVNVWLFFAFVKTLTAVPAFYIAGQKERSAIAFFCAAIWAVYPTHSEAVSWIAARSDLTASTFYLTTMILFAHNLIAQNHALKKSFPRPLIALPLVLGLLSKEMAISIPAALFLLSAFDQRYRHKSWLESASAALKDTLSFFLIGGAYLVIRGLALGDFIGGYMGSIGRSLNQSLVDRWLYTESFFKVFHPFNDQLIPQESPLRLALRAVWGLCGALTIGCTTLAGAVSAKYRLLGFAAGWLLLTLAPNIQVWNFSSTMAGGRIAYLSTAAITLIIVLSVYPLGASTRAGDNWRNTVVKITSVLTMTALIILFGAITWTNNKAWLEASDAVRTIRGQLTELIGTLPDGQRLALLNLPSHVKGAYAFTSYSMLDSLLNEPLMEAQLAKNAVVLDNQPCAYPRVNYADVRAAASHRDSFQLYFYDQDAKKLVSADEHSFGSTAPAASAQTQVYMRTEELDGEDFKLKIEPPVTPGDFEYARVTLTLSPQAAVNKTDKICYAWNNSPPNEDGKREEFHVQLADTPQAGKKTSWLIRLGENKLWLLSKNVEYMEFFVPALKDPDCQLDVELLSREQAQTIAPALQAAIAGEKPGDELITLKHLPPQRELELKFDAGKIAGARGVQVEILPPYNYFDHFTRKMSHPDFCPTPLKVLTQPQLKGTVKLKYSDFPRPAIYQMRAGAVDAGGKVLGDFSEPVTVTVENSN
ncbi:MAG: hypothetical protein JSS86_13305, partial [Cyanobacteria bacterium SZAS LIN-2]|nr:hypothetical protein [Cyanobacteria bacterium SZAS LIN-2]